MNKHEVVVAGVARTPFDSFGGVFKEIPNYKLGSMAFKEALTRSGLKPEDVEEVYMGVNMPSQNRSLARQAAIEAGFPVTVNATTLDRACCSSYVALAMGYRAIALGEIKVAVCGGAENMSRVPYFIEELRWGTRIGDVLLEDILRVSCPMTGRARAVQAGEGALKYGVSREEQDEWALGSQQKYQQALEEGKFKDEIFSVTVPQRKGEPLLVDEDRNARPDTTLEKLAKLKTVYDSATVTPGNAPGLNTGAAGVVLVSRELAEEKRLPILATIVSHAQASDHPDGITYTPAYAAKKALEKANLSIDDMRIIEINEAFAAMPLVSARVLADNDEEKAKEILKKTNVNGGAIAIGHPTGASAARLFMTLALELKRRGGGYGLATICGGIGEGECMVIHVDED